MDDKTQGHGDDTGGGEKKRDANDLAHYLAAEKEEEAWLDRMRAAAKAQKAEEEAASKTAS